MQHPNFCCAGKDFLPLLLLVLVYLVNIQRELNFFLPPHTSVLIDPKMKTTNS